MCINMKIAENRCSIGEFGVVYKGLLLSINGMSTSKTEYVAVKTLKGE